MKDKPLWKQLGLPRPRGLATIPKPGKKPRRAPVQREEQFTIQVAEFFAWALPRSVVWYHVPNGGWRSKGVAGKLKAMGTKRGVHDFVLLYDGIHHELDLKVTGGSLSPEQREHAEAVRMAGGRAGTAKDTIDDVVRQLTEWGIPVKVQGLGRIERPAPISRDGP